MHVYVLASDQADYMAPYITFEDGKLVTKDPANTPAKTHPTEENTDQAQIPPETDLATINTTSKQAEINIEEPGAAPIMGLVGIFVGLFVMAMVYYKIRSKQQRTDPHST